MALVEVEVVDANGNRCPTAFHTVDFELTGPAEWRGGIAQGPDNFILSKKLPVECGVNRVLIRSFPQAGKISIKATAEGLRPASIELASKPMVVIDGLAKVLPRRDLARLAETRPHAVRGFRHADPQVRPDHQCCWRNGRSRKSLRRQREHRLEK